MSIEHAHAVQLRIRGRGPNDASARRTVAVRVPVGLSVEGDAVFGFGDCHVAREGPTFQHRRMVGVDTAVDERHLDAAAGTTTPCPLWIYVLERPDARHGRK